MASALVGGLLVTSLSGCDTSATISDPAGTDTTGNGGGSGGTVQRATLSLRAALPSAEDAALATALGSTGGVLRDADVTIERNGSAASRVTARTDAAGNVRFPDLLPGAYTVSLLRNLTLQEVAQLGPGNEDVIGFGGGMSVDLTASGFTATLEVVAGRRGSLVISEYFDYWPRAADGGYYFFAGYIELYNNSDTTIYLDGKYLGEGVKAEFAPYSYPKYTCAVTAEWRNDPDGIWSRSFWRFPGSGRQYPLSAGQAVVIATDAFDHGQFVPGLPDLRSAGFEFLGPADVDNPSVPEMINAGAFSAYGSVRAHGYSGGSNALTIFVADSVDLAALPRRDIYPDIFGAQAEHRRFPREKILDAFSGMLTQELLAANPNAVPCPENTHPNIDRQRAYLLSVELSGSIQRRVFRTLADGRVMLQRTRTSAQDFERVPVESPGRVP